MQSPLAAHVAHGETGDGRAQALSGDPEDMSDGDSRQQVHDGMTAGHRAFKVNAESAETRAGGAVLHIFGAHGGAFGEPEGNRAAGVDLGDRKSTRLNSSHLGI